MNPVTSHIHRVQLYHRGATVTRRVELLPDAQGNLPETLELPNLPLALYDDSVRLRAIGDASEAVLPRDLRVGLWVAPREVPDPQHAQERLKETERRQATLNREREALEAEATLLSTMDVPDRPRGDAHNPPPPSPMSARLALDEVVDSGISKRAARLHELQDKLRRTAEEVQALRDEISRLSNAQKIHAGEVSKTVIASLQWVGRTEGVALTLELDYFVPGARWAPQYQCRVTRAGDAATLLMRAVIAQNTGEDWRGVRLRLSTADPHGFTELPELPSIRIGRAQPPAPKRGFRPPPQGSAVLFGDYDQGRARLPAPGAPGWRQPATAIDALPTSLWDDLVENAVARRANRLAAFAVNEDEDDSYDEVAASPKGASYARDEMPMAESAIYESRSSSFGAGGMPSPPPSVSAPMPSAGPPRGMPAPAAQPARRMSKKAEAPRAMQMDSFSSSGDELDDLLAELEEMEGGANGPGSAPRFSALQLAPFWEGRRGKLYAVEASALYRELLTRSGRAPNFSVEQYVAQMTQRAEQVGSMNLPQGCSDVRDAAGFFDYAYEADDPIDVPSDGAFHVVNLGTREAPCDVQYVVVPREDVHVFRVARITNPTRAPLLPGPAEVYVQDEYILSTTLPSVAPRGQLRLGLGVEQSIKVARNATFEERRSSEAVVATAELWHTVSIEIVNNLGRQIPLEVRERIPQPAPKAEVVIEEHKVEPVWEQWDQRELGHKLAGGRRWHLTLAPGVKQTLTAEYVVKIYAKNELVGGNRRER
jgi:hypothetical protein